MPPASSVSKDDWWVVLIQCLNRNPPDCAVLVFGVDHNHAFRELKIVRAFQLVVGRSELRQASDCRVPAGQGPRKRRASSAVCYDRHQPPTEFDVLGRIAPGLARGSGERVGEIKQDCEPRLWIA